MLGGGGRVTPLELWIIERHTVDWRIMVTLESEVMNVVFISTYFHVFYLDKYNTWLFIFFSTHKFKVGLQI